MRPLVLSIVVTVVPSTLFAQHDHARSPYAGQELSELVSLSAEEIRQLSSGEGMGLARAAELNRYPGPMHALELAAQLRLSNEQIAAIRAIRTSMLELAIAKGRQILADELDLSVFFREGTPTAGAVVARTRALHLTAHLETRDVLTAAQIDSYDRLRGYHP
jgi:hypothetical protein